MPLRSDNRFGLPRNSLVLFYSAAFASAITIGLTERLPGFRTTLLLVAMLAATVAVWSLLNFLRSTDERERLINYRALMFAFSVTLVFSFLVGLLQATGFQPISWLGIPVLMVTLWSIGLILYSRRYR
jgi:heme/copper-type cytochrome/quinol oxidase subunit 4